MKYIGDPFCTVIDYEKLKKVFSFDENGEFETDDEKLIAWMKKNKPHIKAENNVIDDKQFICKKCGKAFENKGLLLAHYRTHKGGD